MLIETTLREGEQRWGLYLKADVKRQILGHLLRCRVEEIELGVVGRDESLPALLEWAREQRGPGDSPGADGEPRTALALWAPCREAEVAQAAKLAPDRLSVGMPVSDLHLTKRLGCSRRQALRRMEAAVACAGREGVLYISVGLEDASRADPLYVLKAAQVAHEAGASRVRLSDTVGMWNPLEAAALVALVKEGANVEVAVHCHNDFGQATANAVAALGAGADYADVSVLGVGERAGIAALEEVMAYLYFRWERHHYQLAGLRELAALVAAQAGLSLPRHKAVVGEALFFCESGLHVDGLLKDPQLYEPFEPAALSLERRVSVGKKSGRAAVAGQVERLGLARPADMEGLVRRVRACSEAKGEPLNEAEVTRLVKESGEEIGRRT